MIFSEWNLDHIGMTVIGTFGLLSIFSSRVVRFDFKSTISGLSTLSDRMHLQNLSLNFVHVIYLAEPKYT